MKYFFCGCGPLATFEFGFELGLVLSLAWENSVVLLVIVFIDVFIVENAIEGVEPSTSLGYFFSTKSNRSWRFGRSRYSIFLSECIFCSLIVPDSSKYLNRSFPSCIFVCAACGTLQRKTRSETSSAESFLLMSNKRCLKVSTMFVLSRCKCVWSLCLVDDSN